MAQTPKNIMLGLGRKLYSQGRNTATLKEIRKAFIDAGYGPAKVSKWIDLYFGEEIIKEDQRNDEGIMLFSCDWWLPLEIVNSFRDD